ncbi:hypothetical protein NC651_019402 [Populus alba x Populus x berolinensis]|nr:hypothetical protein NC651_019402 [Populus alba x Populus x berolinensis]
MASPVDVGGLPNHVKYCISMLSFQWANIRTSPVEIPYMIQGYRVAIEECQLTGIPLLGFPFTWERGRGTDHWVLERLDRAMGTGPWLHHFTNTELHNLTTSISDHNPLLLVYRKQIIYRKHIRFRFENAWIREPELGGMIRKAWDDTAGERVLQRFSVCTQRLSD